MTNLIIFLISAEILILLGVIVLLLLQEYFMKRGK